MTSVFSWQISFSLCPASFCTPRPDLPVTSGVSWLPTFAFQSSIIKRTFWGVLVLEGLEDLHRTIQLQLLQHYWLGCRLGLLWYWMVCLGNEQRSVLSCSVAVNSLWPHRLLYAARLLCPWWFSRQEYCSRLPMPSSRGPFPPSDEIQFSHTGGGFFTVWATREGQEYWNGWPIYSRHLSNPGIEPRSLAFQVDSLHSYSTTV